MPVGPTKANTKSEAAVAVAGFLSVRVKRFRLDSALGLLERFELAVDFFAIRTETLNTRGEHDQSLECRT